MTQEIKTEKFEGLLVKYPDNASDLVYPKIGMVDLYFHLNNGEYESVTIPQGQWKLIGNPFELNEKQAHEIVNHKCEMEYSDYGSAEEIVYYPDGDTAVEAMEELLNSLQVYKENPCVKKPDINAEKYTPITDDEKDTLFMNDWDKWESIEERTGSWILLEKLNT